MQCCPAIIMTMSPVMISACPTASILPNSGTALVSSASNARHAKRSRAVLVRMKKARLKCNEADDHHEPLEVQAQRQFTVGCKQRKCPGGIENFSTAPHIMVSALLVYRTGRPNSRDV